MYVLGSRSRARLQGVDPRLVKIVELAIECTPVDFAVIEGRRTIERQRQLYGQGRTARQVVEAGLPANLARPDLDRVTDTLSSKHIDGLAVDLAPFVDGSIDWSDPKKFDQISKAMFAAADALGFKLRWGADWDRDGKPRERGETDSPHFELA